jgi:hypothetical protein
VHTLQNGVAVHSLGVQGDADDQVRRDAVPAHASMITNGRYTQKGDE